MKVLQGIVNLIRARKECNSRKPYVILQFIVMSHNENKINEVKALGKKLEVDKTVIKSLQVCNLTDNHYLLPVNSRYSRYKLNNNKEIIIKSRLRNKCRRLWHTMVILNDGCVVPCCFDKDGQYLIGKYPDSSVNDIWNGDQFNNFRQKILNSRKNILMCCNCTEGTSGT